MLTIGIHPIYRRQTETSRHSHFVGTDEELINAVFQQFPLRRSGRKEGTFCVDLLPHTASQCVLTPVVKIKRGDFLNAECIAKEAKELPLICNSVVGRKQPARFAYVVVYSKDALDKVGATTSKNDYDIVALHGSDVENQPDHPYEIARQVLEHGNTSYSTKDICRAIRYWGTHAFAKSKFVRHVDKKIADAIRQGSYKVAVALRQKQVPEESVADATEYVNSLQRFMLETDTLYLDPS